MAVKEMADAFALKALPHSQVELSGDVPQEALAPYKERALKSLAASLELPGFRKGRVPPAMALKKVGDMAVLEEAVELLVRDLYPELIEAKKIDAVGRPSVAITKLAPDNPVSLKMTTAVYPKVAIAGDWETVGASIPLEAPALVEDKEIDDALEALRQSKKAGGTVPALTDEFARSLGAFASVADLKEKIHQGIAEEKARAARDKRRGAIADALLKKTEVDMPAVFIESEIEKILSQLKDDVLRLGMPFEEYLKKVEKTEEELRSGFQEQAAKRAKLQLALNEIAKEENITADKEAAEKEMKHALEHFPNADPVALGIHIQTVLRNEKIFKLLEDETGKK